MGYAEIRTLRADEIECRVSMVNEKGLGLLLYKDARADQKILDETFTPYRAVDKPPYFINAVDRKSVV